MKDTINSLKNYFIQLQDNIVGQIKEQDSDVNIVVDTWQREQGGGGISQAITGGSIFEKGGVNFSHVHGEELPVSATKSRTNIAGSSFDALGVSLVLHPKNPFVPTVHYNGRFFVAYPKDQSPVWWFGGGYDLTPYYPFIEDCKEWHAITKQVCEPFGSAVYPKYKKWCDEYFYLKHRQEHRGIGGIFYDDLNDWGFDKCFEFLQAVSDGFIKAYFPIVTRRIAHEYSEQQKEFQRFRRGRYVEFNLIYDRGTLFGLQSGGRTESILISMPPEANWGYQWQPEPNTPEAHLTEYFLKPKDWANLTI